jgi:hypothetical protein
MSPSPSGKKVLNPRINLLYPLNKFFTLSITPGVLILKRKREKRIEKGKEKWRKEKCGEKIRIKEKRGYKKSREEKDEIDRHD